MNFLRHFGWILNRTKSGLGLKKIFVMRRPCLKRILRATKNGCFLCSFLSFWILWRNSGETHFLVRCSVEGPGTKRMTCTSKRTGPMKMTRAKDLICRKKKRISISRKYMPNEMCGYILMYCCKRLFLRSSYEERMNIYHCFFQMNSGMCKNSEKGTVL
jgi:hypothetical protein